MKKILHKEKVIHRVLLSVQDKTGPGVRCYKVTDNTDEGSLDVL